MSFCSMALTEREHKAWPFHPRQVASPIVHHEEYQADLPHLSLRSASAMRRALIAHPDSRCRAATQIDVEVARQRTGELVLHYVVTGRIGDMRLPSQTAPTRTDNLWQHTCFEAFIRAAESYVYFEINLAPSTQWAAYQFSGYRSGRNVAGAIPTPRVEAQSGGDNYRLRAVLDLVQVPELAGKAAWSLGLSAVIEDIDGRLSHWALAHPPGKADFHHSDCFALELPAASQP
jgi:hypothetical protein